MSIKRLKMNKKGGAGGGLLIKLVVISGLILMPFIPNNTVYAQCPGPSCPTPTAGTPAPTSTPFYGPTIENPFSSTPTPSALGDCPIYDKDPDREVTFDWAYACKHCNTGQLSPIPTFVPQPTWDWESFFQSTAQPAFTPTVTPIPIVKPYLVYGLGVSAVKPGLLAETTYTNQANTMDSLINFVGDSFPLSFGVHQKIHLNSWYAKSLYASSLSFKTSSNPYIDPNAIHIEIVESNMTALPVGTEINTTSWNGPAVDSIQGTTVYDREYEIKYNVTISAGNSAQTYLPQLRWGFYMYCGSGCTWSGTVETTYYEGDVPTMVNGYCSEYEYADDGPGGVGYGTPLVSLPNINIWQGECIDFVPPFEWGMGSADSFLFDIDIDFPGIGICPIWAEIDSLEILEIEIPFDILILPALMFVFSLLFKM